MESNLHLFEKTHRLAMSTCDSGVPWDLPCGWTSIPWLAIVGIKNCGDIKDATRSARRFIATVRDNFICGHAIREKDNVVAASIRFHVEAGYCQNLVGFWTNAVYLKLQQLLRQAGLPATPAPTKHLSCATRP